ncbi:hypothetical protein [Yoonia sp. 208BN28-4]|uniref:hypothetical protein n=1 Tax=Yoonia sp. 208BN28-4 TaxID=3126505 RepID=UPI00309F8F3D
MIAGGIAVIAIAFLTFNVSREIRLLGSAQSDNVQWSLVQTQVEFLEFQKEVDAAPVDLAQLRQAFDIFYSRGSTLQQATVFEGLRDDPGARGYLDGLVSFLDDAVVIVDAPDPDVVAQIQELSTLAADASPVVRALGHSASTFLPKPPMHKDMPSHER